MTILSRYILREALRIFLMAFSGLMTIYLVVDFFEKTRKFSDHDPRFVDVAVYFLFRTPEIAFQMAPLAVLLATLLSLGTLSRTREITAMRSCGMSLFRVALRTLQENLKPFAAKSLGIFMRKDLGTRPPIFASLISPSPFSRRQ